MQNICPRETP